MDLSLELLCLNPSRASLALTSQVHTSLDGQNRLGTRPSFCIQPCLLPPTPTTVLLTPLPPSSYTLSLVPYILGPLSPPGHRAVSDFRDNWDHVTAPLNDCGWLLIAPEALSPSLSRDKLSIPLRCATQATFLPLNDSLGYCFSCFSRPECSSPFPAPLSAWLAPCHPLGFS